MKAFLILTVSLVMNTSFAMDKVIYGDDNRRDIFDTTNSLYLELANSTAAMIAHSKLTDKGTITEISGNTLESRGMCSTIRFSGQITAANCSGFLVGPDLLVTAGHCIQSMSDCNGSAWVFGFAVNADGDKATEVASKDVYKCVEIIERQLDRPTQNDYAMIRLDRAVADRAPLTVRKTGKVADTQSIVVIGHPTGLPTKVSDGANVRTNSNNYFFVANLDTFGGNSGSAVFNAETGEVEGILVRGENDYVWSDENGSRCRVPQQCTNDACRGEDVTRITNIKSLMDIVNQ